MSHPSVQSTLLVRILCFSTQDTTRCPVSRNCCPATLVGWCPALFLAATCGIARKSVPAGLLIQLLILPHISIMAHSHSVTPHMCVGACYNTETSLLVMLSLGYRLTGFFPAYNRGQIIAGRTNMH